MTNKTITLTTELYNYLLKNACQEPELFRKVREETALLTQAKMQISPDQGQFMALLAKLVKAKKALEIGVFTGYSALWVASSLPESGKLIACEINDTWANIAQTNWERAGLSHKIELRLGPALETLEQLSANREQETFDFIFIDADKENQQLYYELALQLTISGGLILIDNALWYGKVADLTVNDKATQAIREFTTKLQADNRVDISLIAIGDGVLLARKK